MKFPSFPGAATVAAPFACAQIIPFLACIRERPLRAGISRAIGLAILTVAAIFAGQACAADAPLTLQEAQRRAVERSQQISALDATVAASRERALAAGQLPDPVLTLAIDNLPINGSDRFSLTRDFMTMRRIGITQDFTRAEKRQMRARKFASEADKLLAEKTAALASIARNTALAWFECYYAEAAAAVLAQQAEEAKLEVVASEGAYRAGRGSQSDILAAHSAQVGLEITASEMGRRVRTARINLARWIGEGADVPLSGKPSIDSLHREGGALDSEIPLHPEIRVLAREEDIVATDARIAAADQKTDWSLEVSYSQRGPAYSNMVSIGVSIPLQWDQKNRQNRELAARLALVERAKAEREEALRAHVGEVRTVTAEWENGRERLARVESEMLPLARERTRAALAAYQGGKAALSEVLSARRGEIDIRMQTVNLEAEIARLWAQLHYLFPAEGVGSTPPHARSQPEANQIKEAR